MQSSSVSVFCVVCRVCLVSVMSFLPLHFMLVLRHSCHVWILRHVCLCVSFVFVRVLCVCRLNFFVRVFACVCSFSVLSVCVLDWVCVCRVSVTVSVCRLCVSVSLHTHATHFGFYQVKRLENTIAGDHDLAEPREPGGQENASCCVAPVDEMSVPVTTTTTVTRHETPFAPCCIAASSSHRFKEKSER